jgi:hypothetical protein
MQLMVDFQLYLFEIVGMKRKKIHFLYPHMLENRIWLMVTIFTPELKKTEFCSVN